MTNAGFPISIDGQDYQTTQLGQAAWDCILNALRAEFIRQQRELYPQDIESIRAQAFKFTRNTIISMNFLFTPTGSIQLLFQMLKPQHPKVTLAKCADWVERGVVDWEVVMNTLTAGAGEAKGEGGEEPENPQMQQPSTPS